MSEATYSPGLEGVVAGVSGISHIDLEQNVLTYRGYNVADLCSHCLFEEVAFLLLFGELPTGSELIEFRNELTANRTPHPQVLEIVQRLPPHTEPMDWLKVAVGAIAAYDPDYGDDSHEANLRKSVRLLAQLPSVLANGYRLLDRQPTMQGFASDTHSENFLRLIKNDAPSPIEVDTLNATLILYAEHGFNASTFSARVTVSTLSDLHSGIIAAIGALKGPLHGGANEEVMRMLLEIGSPANALDWVQRRLTKTPENPHPRIMGFGHREYKLGDQRAKIVKSYLERLTQDRGVARWLEISNLLEDYMLREKKLYPNLDFPVSPAYYLMGLPIPLYTPIFVLSRVTGWCAHIMEQLNNNRIIRPTSIYQGPGRKEFVPLEAR